MNRQELAVEYKHSQNNCCQAVLLAFSDVLGLDKTTLRQLGAGFGVGMGCMEATCGALIGAQIALGLKSYDGLPILGEAKKFHGKFRELCQSTYCRELKGIDTGVVLCECDDCVRNAVKLVEERFPEL